MAERIDAHHHLWDLDRRAQPWTTGLARLERSFVLDDLRPCLAANSVEATVLVHTVASLDETFELLELAAANPVIAGVVGWFDLTAPGLADEIARAQSIGGLVGVRHQLQVESDPYWLARADVRAGLRTLAATGLAYDLVVSPHQLPLVTDTVHALPEVRFVLDHAGKPPIASGDIAQWRAAVTALAALPNVAVKVSGLMTEADWTSWTPAQLRPVVEHVLAVFGADRTMFGSDWPVCLLAASYDTVVATTVEFVDELSASEQAAVWAGSARAWYGLEVG